MAPSETRTPRPRHQPACHPCRKRKSRCKYEPADPVCLMCRAHQTECEKVPERTPRTSNRQQRGGSRRHYTVESASLTAVQPTSPFANRLSNRISAASAHHPPSQPQHDVTTPRTHSDPSNLPPTQTIGLSLDTDDEENPHILAPATAYDSHFLDDYLSTIPTFHSTTTSTPNLAIRPVLPGTTASSCPVVFMRLSKRPLGLSTDPNPCAPKLQTIIKLLEPHHDRLIRVYFEKGNVCFPILHEDFLREEESGMKRSRVSKAVLASLYAHAICYWKTDEHLRRQRCPDGRFIWNLALDCLYTELHMSPGMPSIISILLNIGGRPATTMVGNGMLLGSAVALAQSIGLNRDPLPWNITTQEKIFRINVWWCLVIHDRFTSLTHGTPPHIRHSHHDVPLPEAPDRPSDQARIFQVLASLSTILGEYLEALYSIRKRSSTHMASSAARLSQDLTTWTDSLPADIRRIIVRGTNLDIPGAGNLRLCYLAIRFFNHRLELNINTDQPGTPLSSAPSSHLLQGRTSAEDIVLFVRELTPSHLRDFWLPTGTFVLSSCLTFLLSLAVQTEFPSYGSTPSFSTRQSLSLSLAHDLMTALREHKDDHGWELGDTCLARYTDVVERLMSQQQNDAATEVDLSWLDSATFLADPGFLDSVVDEQLEALAWSQTNQVDNSAS